MSFSSQKHVGLILAGLAASGVGLAIALQPESVARPSSGIPIAAQAATAIPFDVCGESPTWVRPNKAAQIKQLQSMGRYGADVLNKPLNNQIQRFWQQDVFAFTQYGLSLRMEPVYFSGLWTVQDTLWQCYDAPRATQINAGKTAEVWVLSHRVSRIQWTGNQYIMVVQPARTGVQFVQFPRREARSTLPLKVVTQQGTPLSVVPGN